MLNLIPISNRVHSVMTYRFAPRQARLRVEKSCPIWPYFPHFPGSRPFCFIHLSNFLLLLPSPPHFTSRFRVRHAIPPTNPKHTPPRFPCHPEHPPTAPETPPRLAFVVSSPLFRFPRSPSLRSSFHPSRHLLLVHTPPFPSFPFTQ